jgi:hypothetical protein
VVAEGAVRQLLTRGDRALEHHLAVAGHLQVHGPAPGQPHTFTPVEARKQPFAQLHRDRRGRRQHQQRMHADGDGDLERLAQRSRLAQVAGAAAHAQPVHGHRVDRLLLQPVHAHVRRARLRVLGDHQAEGDDPAAVAGPGPQQRQFVEVHLLPLEHLLLAGGREIEIRSGPEQINQHRAEAQRLPRSPGRSGLLQQCQLLPQGLQVPGLLHPQTPEHPLLGAEQIDRHRHGAADHVLEQQGRSPPGQCPIGDGSQLQIRIHRRRDPAQFTALLQQLQKATQIAALLAPLSGHGDAELLLMNRRWGRMRRDHCAAVTRQA